MTSEERLEKKRLIEEKALLLLPDNLKGKTVTQAVVLKSGMTKIITRVTLETGSSREQGGVETS